MDEALPEYELIHQPANYSQEMQSTFWAVQPLYYLMYQNDKLTFKVANGGDLWIHTQKTHGSHVIVFAEGREIPENVVEIACEIAAFYSIGANATKQECDYTFRRNLKRHPSNKPGMVLYTTYKTAYVTPNKHEEYLAK